MLLDLPEQPSRYEELLGAWREATRAFARAPGDLASAEAKWHVWIIASDAERNLLEALGFDP